MSVLLIGGCGEKKSSGKEEMSKSEMQKNDVEKLQTLYNAVFTVVLDPNYEVSTDMHISLYCDKKPSLEGTSNSVESGLVEIMGDLGTYKLLYEEYDGYGVEYILEQNSLHYVKPDGTEFQIVNDKIYD